jgi:2,3-diketo-5-methylthio-1-phosphopentane phosphatase
MSQARKSQESPQVYLLDVEGTVAPITLVSEQLFPYARAHFEDFLKQNQANLEVAADLTLLAQENRNEPESGCPIFGAASSRLRWEDAIPYLNWLMDHDRKSTALKSLQGKIWKLGFESGELKGTLFADVPDALRRWSANAKVAIYSSGSVEAQRLVFYYSTFDDLTPYISAYFDTRIGPKTACASYAAIAAEMGGAPGDMLFLSDVLRELDPAREAGCGTRLVVREGNAPVVNSNGHEEIQSFNGLL